MGDSCCMWCNMMMDYFCLLNITMCWKPLYTRLKVMHLILLHKWRTYPWDRISTLAIWLRNMLLAFFIEFRLQCPPSIFAWNLSVMTVVEWCILMKSHTDGWIQSKGFQVALCNSLVLFLVLPTNFSLYVK